MKKELYEDKPQEKLYEEKTTDPLSLLNLNYV